MPLESTHWTDSFTVDDYKAFAGAIFDGTIKVSNDVSVEPAVENVTVEYLGNVKESQE